MSFCAIALGTKFQTIIPVSRVEDFQRKADDETIIVENVGAHCQVRALIRLSQCSADFSSWDTRSPNAGRRPSGLEIFRVGMSVYCRNLLRPQTGFEFRIFSTNGHRVCSYQLR
jgi:hypothetical protein